jgi:WD40 repeat protein
MDRTLRIFDLPSARWLQVIHLGHTVTSFSLSPDCTMLAISLADQNSIYVWSSRVKFRTTSPIISPKKYFGHSITSIDKQLSYESIGLESNEYYNRNTETINQHLPQTQS